MANLWREIEATWQGGSVFTSEKDGVTIQLGKTDGKGIGPMEAVLMALASCTGDDVVSILNKKRQRIDHLKISARGLRVDVTPSVYTEIHLEFVFHGNNLAPNDIEQAIQLSEEKYCSVGAMLNKTAKIHTSFKILPSGSEAFVN